MPGPKVTKEDEKLFPALKAVSEQLYKDLSKNEGLCRIYEENSSYKGESKTVTVRELQTNLRDLKNKVDPAFAEPLNAMVRVMDALDRLGETNTKNFDRVWNGLTDDLAKMNGYDEAGVFHPEKTLTALVHQVYGAGEYGEMTKDPNSQVLLALGSIGSKAMMVLANTERDFQISKLEQKQVLDSKTELEDEKRFFDSLQEDPKLAEIISDEERYQSYLQNSATKLDALDKEKKKSDEVLDAELLKRQDLQQELAALEKQAAEDVSKELLPKQKEALDYKKSLYRKNHELKNQELEEENREIEEENRGILENNQKIEKDIATVEATRTEKLAGLRGINRRDFIEQETLKYENQVNAASTKRDKLEKERKDLSGVVKDMLKLRSAKEFLSKPLNIPSEEQLKAVDAAGDDYRLMDKMFHDLSSKFGRIRGLNGLNAMLANPKNAETTLKKLGDLEKNFHAAEGKLKENTNSRNTEKLQKNVSEAKEKWENAKSITGWTAQDIEAYGMVSKFLNENKDVKTAFETIRKNNPKGGALDALFQVNDAQLEKFTKAESQYQAYFDNKYTVEHIKTIMDTNGKHYETLLDTAEDVQKQIDKLSSQIKEQDEIINYKGYKEDVEKRAEGLLDGDQREAIRTVINKEADEQITKLRAGIRKTSPLKTLRTKEEIEAAVEDDVYSFKQEQKNALEDSIQQKQAGVKADFLKGKREVYRNAVAQNHLALGKDMAVVKGKHEKAQQLLDNNRARAEKKQTVNAELQTVKQGKNSLTGRIQDFLDQSLTQIDLGKRRFHRDTREFLNMKNGLTALCQYMKDHKTEIDAGNTQALDGYQQKLREAGEAAKEYRRLKLEERHLNKPTNMRLLRLRFAEDLASFAEMAAGEVQTMRSLENSKMKNLETKLTQSMKLPADSKQALNTESLSEYIKSGVKTEKKPVKAEPVNKPPVKEGPKKEAVQPAQPAQPGLPGKG